MRSSSDWVRTRGGEWIKAPVQQTRGPRVVAQDPVAARPQVFPLYILGLWVTDDPRYEGRAFVGLLRLKNPPDVIWRQPSG